MNTELFLNNDYVNELCSDESVSEVIPYLLGLLPVKEIPRTSTSDKYVEALRQDSDSIHAFLTSQCETGEGLTIDKNILYESYCKYCIDTGRESCKKHSFMRNVRAQGFKEVRDSKSRDYLWGGVTLKKGGRS